MQEKFQKKFNDLVNEILNETPGQINNDEFGRFQSVVSIVYSLIYDGSTNELDAVLKIHFPAYYYNTEIPLLNHPN